MIRSNPEHFQPLTLKHMTGEDSAIVNDLGSVAFMAWLAEARDGDDARYMRLLCAARSVGRDCMQTIILQGD